MLKDIQVPALGESVTQATVARWLKQIGQGVHADEPLVELETDKITLEINAPMSGVLQTQSVMQGSTVAVGDVLGVISDDATGTTIMPEQATNERQDKTLQTSQIISDTSPHITVQADPKPSKTGQSNTLNAISVTDDPRLKMPPSVTKIVHENDLNPLTVSATGKGGRLIKDDVVQHLLSAETTQSQSNSDDQKVNQSGISSMQSTPFTDPLETKVPLSKLRLRIAERLKSAQNTAALLTTFNEIDMTAVMSTRSKYKDIFEKKYGVRLGFMSFFVKACLMALKEIPATNAEIKDNDLILKKHYDIGVAVSAPQGLVVPVLRHVDQLSFAEIEQNISELGRKAKDNKLALSDLSGGTFTITNGGVFGSLMSTPIINPPQSAILGMHKIQDRPIAVDGAVVICPMMYIALTYDHRIIDGREAVTFLVRVKECLENPERILLDI